MIVVVREGSGPSGDADHVRDLLGPDGEVARAWRAEPGFLGTLLLVRGERDGDERMGFVLIEMWAERAARAWSAGAELDVAGVEWRGVPREFDAVR